MNKKPVAVIIDDEESIRMLVQFILEKEGMNVFEASDGTSGLAMACSHEPDLIVIDLIMPDKEGIETIRELRTRYPDCGIIAMSGATNSEYYLSMAQTLGADQVLRKPFQRAEFIEVVRKTLTLRTMKLRENP